MISPNIFDNLWITPPNHTVVPKQRTWPDLDGSDVEITEFEYDAQGRVTKKTVTRKHPRKLPDYTKPIWEAPQPPYRIGDYPEYNQCISVSRPNESAFGGTFIVN